MQEKASRNFYNDFKTLDANFLKPLFGGRTSSHPLDENENEALLSDGEDEELADRGTASALFAASDFEQNGRYQSIDRPSEEDISKQKPSNPGQQTSLDFSPSSAVDTGWPPSNAGGP